MRNLFSSTMLGLLVVLAGSANASPGVTRLDGIITKTPSGLSFVMPVGDPFYIELLLNDAQPNLIASPDYHAINVGTLASVVLTDVVGTVDDVSVSGGTWTSHMRIDLTSVLVGVYLPMTVTITGTGNTPGQILPDFTTILSSLVVIDLTALAGLIIVDGATEMVITSITNTYPPHLDDADGDGVLDSVDNCRLVSNADQADLLDGGDGVGDACDNCTTVKNADQRDSNGDGYGNLCDADLDNNNVVNFADLAILKSKFFGSDPNVDLDGNGVVNFADLAIMKKSFFKAPGPAAGKP